MILRVVTLAGGLAGAAATSQFPEFSQQYMQRLGGAVDALGQVVADFDASARAVGLDRQAALAQMTGTEFLDRRRSDMTGTIARYERLHADLDILQGQGPFMRAYHLPRLTDTQIAQAAWKVYQPAMPLNLAGGIFAGFGFILVAGVLTGLFSLLGAAFRRKSSAEPA